METPKPEDTAPSTPEAQLDLKTFVKRLGPAAILGIIAIACPILGTTILATHANEAGKWLRDHGSRGVGMYVAGFIVLTGLALLPTYASSMLGGWAFGFQIGSAAALVGFTGAATIGYLIGRLGSGERVEKIIEEHPRWKAIRDALVGGSFFHTLWIVILVRFPPSSPFAIANLVFASVKTNPVAYVLGTAIGMAPRTCLYVYIASGLAKQLDAEQVATTKQPVWIFAGGLVALAVVMFILTRIAQKALKHLTAPQAQ